LFNLQEIYDNFIPNINNNDSQALSEMHKLRLNITLAFLLILIILPLTAYTQKNVRTVLFFGAWNSSNLAYQHIIEGFRNSFSEDTDITFNLLTEYLDVIRFKNNDYAQVIIDMYNEKYRKIPIDLIITVGPSCYQILENYGLEAIKNSPVITIFNDQMGNGSANNPSHKNLYNLTLKFDFLNTIQTAIKLFPDNKNIYVVSGVSAVDEYFTEIIRSGTRDINEPYNFNFISGISIDSTLRVIEQIPPKSIILVSNYQMDSDSILFSTPEIVGMIADKSSAPVFMLYDSFRTMRGGIGGYLFSFINVGKEVGNAARQVINGITLQDVEISQNGFFHYAYDWQELKKWGLSSSKVISGDSIFYNQDLSFLSKYKWYVAGFILFILLQTLLILYLYRLNKRQKLINIRMLETESMFRDLVREDRMAKMTELTASLSHELNQPLTAILFNAQAGKRFLQAGKLDTEQAGKILDNIIASDKRAGGIISSVRSLTRLEVREKEKIDLHAVIRETIDIVHNDAIKRGIELSTKFNAGEANIFADKIQLQQVLLNFIRNAEIALEGNDPDDKKLDIVTSVSDLYVTVSVRDNGTGIDTAIKEKLFKPFVTTRKGGSGIGLALSRTIIENHNGTIWAENIPGGGAEFSFRLHLLKNE